VFPDALLESLPEPYPSMLPKISPERLPELYPDTYPIKLTRSYLIAFLGWVPLSRTYPKTSSSASHLDLGLFRSIMHQDRLDNPKPTRITPFPISETESALPEFTQASKQLGTGHHWSFLHIFLHVNLYHQVTHFSRHYPGYTITSGLPPYPSGLPSDTCPVKSSSTLSHFVV
jgi:hypothetical protein